MDNSLRYGADIDGTLLNYGKRPGEPDVANLKLIKAIAKETSEIALITNQGGIGIGFVDVADWVKRVRFLVGILAEHNIDVKSIQISIYHDKADPELLPRQSQKLADALWKEFDFSYAVFIAPNSRKPHPLMLDAASVNIYYGDSQEDEDAAKWSRQTFFRKVERFR